MSDIDFNILVKENRRESDDFVCSTTWAKKFGKEWAEYKRLPRCQKLSTALAKKLNVGKSHVMQSKRGKGGETWVHPVIAVDFAEWLSTDFGIFVKEIFLRYLDGDAELGAELMIRDHNRERQERAKNRLLVCDTNKETAELATKYSVSHGEVHNDRYRGLYHKTASQLRQEAGISAKETPLDHLSRLDLSMNSLANQLALQADDPSSIYGFASDIRESYEKRIKKPLVPTWEKIPLSPVKARKMIANNQLELPIF
jgi:hypothetical protein